MKEKNEAVRKLGFVSTSYLLENLGISSTVLSQLKSYGIIKNCETSRGVMRGYYTYTSFKRLKDFMDEYKGYFGHPASLKACLTALEKRKKDDSKT